MECTDSKCACNIPRRHEHTGEMVETYYTEYWCPSDKKWVMCSAPCPDGMPHKLSRQKPIMSEQLRLL